MLQFDKAKVLVIGDVMLDRYWYGQVDRLSPEAPVPIIAVEKEEYRPGGAANVALNLASLEAEVYLVGLVGDDRNADRLEESLKNSGVHCHLVRMDQSPTISKLRIVSRQQQLIRADFEDGFPLIPEDLFDAHLEPLWDKVNLVVFSDYAKGCLRFIEPLIAQAKQRNKKVLVDPKGADFGRYAEADVVTPNASEFRQTVGDWSDDSALVNKAKELAEVNELGAILITRSEQGMSWVPLEGEVLHIPTEAHEVFDVSGAGDTVIATLAAALAIDTPSSQAVNLANKAAGIVVAKQGTAVVDPTELFPTSFMHSDQMMVTELQQSILIAKSRGDRIVMTNGCFDIVHAGHIDSLEKARALGDKLIVAVNSDASIKRLKGENRPIHNITQRLNVLQALRCVDWIIVFGDDLLEQDSPKHLYEQLLPDVLVKGGDYQVEDIEGAQAVIDNGGEVVTIDLVEGLSTSNIIAKMTQE